MAEKRSSFDFGYQSQVRVPQACFHYPFESTLTSDPFSQYIIITPY